ncbi:MAG: helix-turn-helix transcriptional regulator [Cyanobacteria bacterium Co-bin8]|nr:helix-turn-helix transcriptional regulator [Cyanobacteria bacterium Co-bin8]
MSNFNEESPIVLRRRQLKITQKDIAETVGVSERTVNHWENGRFQPKLKPHQTAAFCRLLRCDIFTFASYFPEPDPKKPSKGE